MKKVIFLTLFLLSVLLVAAQTDSIQPIDNSTTINLIQQAEKEHLSDSLKKILLTEQLNALQQNETKQKQFISQQLMRLNTNDSLRDASLQRKIDSLRKQATGAPVIIGKDTFCLIYTHIGSFSPDERAAHCKEQILKAAKIFSARRDSLSIIANEHSTDIVFNDLILFGLTDQDAAWEETDRNTLARNYRERLLHIITDYQESISLLTILKQVGLCLLVIFLQYLLIKGVNYLFRHTIDEKIRTKKGEWFTGIKLRTFEVLNPDKQVNFFLFITRIVRYLVNLIQLYITIPILFSIFPVTQRLAETLFGWILTPVTSIVKGFIGYLPKLFMVIVIVIIMRYIVRFLRYLSDEIATERLKVPGFYPDWAKATFNITRLFLYAFMLVMIFPLLPSSDTEVFKGVSVFIGIVFSLGSSSIIANMVAGMVITYMRPFKIGDRIKIGELTGDVIEKSPFVTRVKTHKNEIVTVPNSNILSSSVINYSFSAAENGLILYTTVTIGYDVPWKQVHAMLIKAAGRTEHILKTPKPFVLQTSLDDFYVSYQLCAYTREASLQASIYSELHQNIQDSFNEEQVEIMSPHYRANRNGNTSTIPANYFDNEQAK